MAAVSAISFIVKEKWRESNETFQVFKMGADMKVKIFSLLLEETYVEWNV